MDWSGLIWPPKYDLVNGDAYPEFWEISKIPKLRGIVLLAQGE